MTKIIIIFLLFTLPLKAAAEIDPIEAVLGIRVTGEMARNPTWFAGIDRFEAKLVHAYRHYTPKTKSLLEEVCKRQNQHLAELGFTPKEKPSFRSFAFQPLICLAGHHTPSQEEAVYLQLTKQSVLYHYLSTTKKPEIQTIYKTINIPAQYPKYSNVLNRINVDRDRTIIVPIVGHAELGIAFLVACFLNDIFPYGVALIPAKGHGIPFTPLGFSIHDLVHIYSNGHVPNLIQDFFKTIICNMSDEISNKAVSSLYMETAMKKENLRRQIFISILQDIIDTQDIKSLIAYFLGVHETYLEYDYSNYDLYDNLVCIFTRSLEEYCDRFQWDSYIECDFKTGFTKLTDIQIALLCYPDISPEDIIEVEIERTDRFLIIKKLNLSTDHKERTPAGIPLLKDKLYDADDLTKLLNIAEYTTPRAPTEEYLSYLTFENQIEAVEIYVNEIINITENLFSHFNDFIDSFAKKHEEMYRSTLTNLEKEFQEKLRILVDTAIKQE